MKTPQYYSRFANTLHSSGGNLPHWFQSCAVFVTFRLADSLPKAKLAVFREERDNWLKRHPVPWDERVAAEYHEHFPQRFHKWLDAGLGSCILADSKLRKIVESTLVYGTHGCDCLNRARRDRVSLSDANETFASTRAAHSRYSLYAYVVMPNHVHVLFMPEADEDGRRIVSEWKRYTARAINALRGTKGSVWQKESYDHLIRDVNEFNACRAYIRSNAPERAFDVYAE